MYKLNFNNIFIPRRIDEIEERERVRVQRLLQQEVIEGDLDLQGINWIEDLGNIREVRGYLYLQNSSIKSLGKLERVDESLFAANSQIQSLGNLQYIKGYLDLHDTPIQSLGNLEHVGWSLDLENTPIQSLGNLRYVGRELYLQNTPLSKLPKKELNKILSKIEIGGEVYVK
jgi:hypothetical protein